MRSGSCVSCLTHIVIVRMSRRDVNRRSIEERQEIISSYLSRKLKKSGVVDYVEDKTCDATGFCVGCYENSVKLYSSVLCKLCYYTAKTKNGSNRMQLLFRNVDSYTPLAYDTDAIGFSFVLLFQRDSIGTIIKRIAFDELKNSIRQM